MRWFLCLVLPVTAFLASAALMAIAMTSGARPELASTGFSWEIEGADPAVVMIAHYRAQVNLVLLTVAFTAVAIGAIWMSYEAAARIARQDKRLWVALMAVFACAGAVLVVVDPIGPMVGCDVRFDTACGLGHPDVAPHLVAAVEAGLVGRGGVVLAAGLILFSGTLAGPLIAAFLLFFVEVARPVQDVAALRLRKDSLLKVVAIGSVALSLGVAMIDAFLNWAIPFLAGDAKIAAAELASVGTMFWGTAFALFSMLAAAMAALSLRRGIDGVAEAKQAPPEWRRAEGLEFEPFRAVAAILAATSPVLTSSVLSLIGGLS